MSHPVGGGAVGAQGGVHVGQHDDVGLGGEPAECLVEVAELRVDGACAPYCLGVRRVGDDYGQGGGPFLVAEAAVGDDEVGTEYMGLDSQSSLYLLGDPELDAVVPLHRRGGEHREVLERDRGIEGERDRAREGER